MNCPVICQSVQSQMADFSSGQLSPVEANAFEQHCAVCAGCQSEWETFQDTLLLLSGLCQPLPCEDSSDEMWDVCASDWMMRVEMHRTKMPLWGAIRGWAKQQPRWGWVAISGAVTIFVGVWMLSSSNAPADAVNLAVAPTEVPADGGPLRVFGSAPNSVAQSGWGILPYSSRANRVEFTVPPAMASDAVDYHAAMSFGPFVDHVGSGLVSSSAQPMINQTPPAQPVVAPPVVPSVVVSTEQSPLAPPLATATSPAPISTLPVATPTLEASVSVAQ